MSRGPISGDIYSLLMAQGLGAGDRVGARKQARKKRRSLAASANGLADAPGGAMHRPAGREGGERGPVWLIVNNTTMTKRARSRARLVMLDGGLA